MEIALSLWQCVSRDIVAVVGSIIPTIYWGRRNIGHNMLECKGLQEICTVLHLFGTQFAFFNMDVNEEFRPGSKSAGFG